MLGQCQRSANPKAWLFLLKRPYSSRNSFHALERSALTRSTLVSSLHKILLRSNVNNSIRATFPERNFANSSKNSPGPGRESKGEQKTSSGNESFEERSAQNVNESCQRVGRIELVDRTIDVGNVERSGEFIDGSEENLDSEKSEEATKTEKASKYFFTLSVGAGVGLLLYYTYSAAMKTFVDKVDVELKILGHEYGACLARKSYPFEDFIEKLLKSGNVKRIIHFPTHKKLVVVVTPGTNIEGLPTGKEAIPLNLFSTHGIHALKPAAVAREVRRLEKQIGIKSSGAVPIEVVGHETETPWYSMPLFVFIFGVMPSMVFLIGRKEKKHWKAATIAARRKPP
ncbi:hypothetical protein DdX_15144 [Ditylenchus destructor]|uniref:Uncharacterized protein n=1 Tax=Ditylenchus destructor TaxID=166010 RepID=A0AAD4MQ12_9BILA|nr:hypothetical protein DdX_15144 [Ditylenchus destructor]